ncbi:terpene cyclase [Kitasatospora sp. NPDC059571]|uniref:terpene synthase family protein n=1 Tax=Kitasatospora sp. NPDC059571 TaxID=3346871 RepID=UPI00368A1427
MPQDVSFAVPFEARVNPFLERARGGHVEWVRESGLVCSEAGLEEYLSWDVPRAAAQMYPLAWEDDLRTVMDWLALDALLGRPTLVAGVGGEDRAADALYELGAVAFRPAGEVLRVRTPLARAWAQVWESLSEGMSERWCDRVSASWARRVAARVADAERGTASVGLEGYLEQQRRTVGAHWIDAVERLGGVELPAQVSAHALTRRVRTAAVDVVAWVRDVHGLEHSEQEGDQRNLVTVLRGERGYSRHAAIDEALWMTRQQLQVYRWLETEVPELCDELWLVESQREAVDTVLEGVGRWIRGCHDWTRDAGRPEGTREGTVSGGSCPEPGQC